MGTQAPTDVGRADAWKQRFQGMESRAFAARQREMAAASREAGSAARAEAAQIRAEAAAIRDDGARTRDDAARVRDGAALIRDQAAQARDRSTRSREETLRRRLKAEVLDRAEWQVLLELDRVASDEAREAAARDREAASLDRVAAERDRQAAERDRVAASKDRDAADKDRDAAESESRAADADRAAAEADRESAERDLLLADQHLNRTDRLAVMGRMAAGIAHEINTPLAALTTTLEALKERIDEDPQARALTPLVDDARLASEQIARVISDVNAWLHSGEDQPARQPVDIERIVNDSLRLAARELEPAARVVLAIEPTRPVWGVAHRLSQALLNLLLNAAHAVSGPRDENEIRVSVREVDQRVVIEVKDTGAGIAPEVLPHIFDPFFTTREGHGGTGQGLAMCQRIAQEHGGSVTAQSEPGHGATFRLALPIGDEGALAAGPPRAAGPSDRPRVLVIDDDAAYARSVSSLMSGRSSVTIAVNGAEGLELLLAPGAHWDLVLCDLMMPVMNGLELYRRLSAIDPARASSLVFVSGGATTDETAAFLDALPNVQLQKPFKPQRLYELLEERTRAATT